MPTVIDGAVWKRISKGQAGIGWEREVEEVRKEIARNQDGILPIGERAV